MNNTLKKSSDAVSPVVGVILMVAITVVLAAIVFLLVSRLSSQSAMNTPVNLGVTHNSDHSFTVASIDQPIAWTNVTIKDNGISQTYTVNGVTPHNNVAGGDHVVISGLTTGNHQISFVYRNNVIYSTTFVV